MNTDPVFQAITAHDWYALSGLVIAFLLLVARTRTDVLSKLTGWQQWLLGLGIAAGGAFVTAQVGGHPFSYAITAVAVSVVSAAMGMAPGVGHQDAAKTGPTKPSASKAPIVSMLLLCLVLPLVTGCGLLRAAAPVLADVAVVAEDASQILDALDAWFSVHRDSFTPAQQAAWSAAMTKARTGVDTALRTAKGAKELDEHDEAAAFADFQAAYRELEGLVASMKSAHPAAAPRVPPPLAMGLRA